MISVECVEEVVPFGRRVVDKHPKQFFAPNRKTVDTFPLCGIQPGQGDLRGNEEDEETVEVEEQWELGPAPGEELYVRERTVVWSRGGAVRKCFTFGEPVRQVLRCSFLNGSDRPTILPHQQPQQQGNDNSNTLSALCIRLPSVIRVFCESGQDFNVALQFSVTGCWETPFGLILERQVLSEDRPRPVLFSLLHPLDDFTRVIYKQGAKLGEWTDQSNTIVYTSTAAAIAVTYNSHTEQHSVWKIRRARPDEAEKVDAAGSGESSNQNSAALVSLTPSGAGSSRFASHSPSLAHTPGSLAGGSRLRPGGSGLPTPGSFPATPSHSRPASPLLNHNHQRTSGAASPCNYHLLGSAVRGGVSPSFSSKVTARLGESPTRFLRSNVTAIEDDLDDKPLPLEVTLCFEHLWLEPLQAAKETGGKAKKVFLTSDAVGQSYLALLLDSWLNIVKLDYSNDESGTMIFGAVKRIAAVDAAPLPHLDMILVLSSSGSLLLYTGVIKMSTVLLPASPTSLLSQEISALALDTITSQPPTPVHPLNLGSQPPTPLPVHLLRVSSNPATPLHNRRASFLTSSRPPSATIDLISETSSRRGTGGGGGILRPFGNDSLSLMSPLRPPAAAATRDVDLSCATITSVRGGAEGGTRSDVILGFSSGHQLRLVLPPVASSLVSRALAAVQQLLPRELAIQLHGAWYSSRHAPGPGLGRAEEWRLFCKCLLALAGYQVDRLDLSLASEVSSGLTGSCPKKSRTEEEGTDGDWQALLDSSLHQQAGHAISRLLRLKHVLPVPQQQQPAATTEGEINSGSTLFTYIPAIFLSLHLLYEEMKLDTTMYGDLHQLANLLSRLAGDLRLAGYQHLYWQDFPDSAVAPLPATQAHLRPSQLSAEQLERLNVAAVVPPRPLCIHSHLAAILTCQDMVVVEPWPLLAPPLSSASEVLITCYAVLASSAKLSGDLKLERFLRPVAQPGRPTRHVNAIQPSAQPPAHLVAELLVVRHGWDRLRLGQLPPSLALPLLAVLASCRLQPSPNWGADILRMVGREDLAENSRRDRDAGSKERQQPQQQHAAIKGGADSNGGAALDGLEGLEGEISRLRWPRDQRRLEARRILQSSRPVTVPVLQRPEISDHDYLEEQEHYLKRLCERTMALPIGRGMAALLTTTPLPTEVLAIPPLCLTGRAPPRGTKVELSHIDYSSNMEHWPSFHNGVAAGLRLAARPDSQDIDSTWIAFNQPQAGIANGSPAATATAEATAETEHAGFLMALGLNGHLSKLSKLDSFEYLMKGSEPISIGLLLGMAATHRGSMDVMVTKKLATQLEALLPPSATELPLSPNTQVAALAGLGLVYANTGHRHMVEVCLQELARPPGPELEHAADRESYSLTAGLALGLIAMGQADRLTGGVLADLNLPDLLHSHMVGGPRGAGISQPRREGGPVGGLRPPSYQIKEGDSINIDVTSPGATLALGMLYWKTGNRNIASWMAAPETIFLLDFVRPDFLMLRTLARGLILWDEVVPSVSWVESHVPSGMRAHCLVRPPDVPVPGISRLDYETLNQAYCNIVAGAALVLGLRFAGTWNREAVETLDVLAKKFIAVSKRSIADLTGKAVIEQTICVAVLAQAVVMAGSGDLGVLRTCRYLRSRVHNTTIITYGSHMAVHMAVGLLFLGGGRLGLNNSSPTALAAMIIAFFPKFPTHSNDNRYHLQALRHLYVLATEPRLVLPRSISHSLRSSKKILTCTLSLQYCDTPWYRGPRVSLSVPNLLPPLDLLAGVTVEDSACWPARFAAADASWTDLRRLLQEGGGVLYVKERSGLPPGKGFAWTLSEDQLRRLEESGLCSPHISILLKDCPQLLKNDMQTLLYSCLAKEQSELFPLLLSFLSFPGLLGASRAGLVALHLRTALRLVRHIPSSSSTTALSSYLDPELFVSLSQRVCRSLDLAGGSQQLGQAVRQYLVSGGAAQSDCCGGRQLLASYTALNELPHPLSGDQSADVMGRLSRNPLKAVGLLGPSPHPASLFRLLIAGR